MRRALLVGFTFGTLGLLLLDALAVRAGLAPGILPRIAGQTPWIVSRALGITAFVSLTAEVVLGLLSSSGTADRLMGRARAVDVHRWLSTVTLALVGGHALVLLLDAYVRFDLLDLVVPLVTKERRIGVALGIVAAYLALVIHLSSRFRKEIGAKAWRRWHYASFAVFVAVVAHGLAAGTDASTTPMRLVYLGSAILVALLTGRRIATAMAPAPRARSRETVSRGAPSA